MGLARYFHNGNVPILYLLQYWFGPLKPIHSDTLSPTYIYIYIYIIFLCLTCVYIYIYIYREREREREKEREREARE